MGEITEMILMGVLCQKCGGFIDGFETDYPRSCHDCQDEPAEHKKGK